MCGYTGPAKGGHCLNPRRRGAGHTCDICRDNLILLQAKSLLPWCITAIEEESDRREGKGRYCCLGTYVKYMMNAALGWFEVLVRTSIFRGRWFGVVWTRWLSIIPKHSLRSVSVLQFILFFKSLSGAKSICSAAWFRPQLSATTFAFSFVWFFFYGYCKK